MKKNSRALLRVSRFIILGLSIVLQVALLLVGYLQLNQHFAWLQTAMSLIGFLMFIFIVNRDQAAVYKIPWVILFCLFPVLAVVIYFTFGNVKLSKKHIKKLNSVFETDSEEVKSNDDALSLIKRTDGHKYGQIKYITDVCSLSVYNDSYVEFLPCGEDFFKCLKEELKKAKKYVFFEYFIIEEGIMWNELREILLQKIKEGVEVFVMYDDVGCMPRLDKNYYAVLESEGFNCVKFNPFRPIVSIVHNNRDHRKITVIDGEVAFTGGANIADEYINAVNPFGKWKDTAVVVKGRAADSFVKMFCQLYNMSSKTKIDYKNYICNNHRVYSGYGYVVPYMDGPAPVYPEHIAENVYLNVINQAVDYLYITTPYLVVDNDIIDSLKNAARRGVDVKIILPEIPDKKLVSIMTKSNYEKLINYGVKIYEYKNGFIHSKTFVSDGVGIVGTVNLDYRSLVHHFECAVWTCNNKCVDDMKSDFEKIIDSESKLISKEDAKQNAFAKIIKNVMYIFSPLF